MTTDAAPTTAPPTPGMSLPARVVGVIFSPTPTYADVAARPRIVGMLVLIAVVNVAAAIAFFSTEESRQIMLDQAISAIELIGFNPPEEVYQQIEDSMMNQPAWRQALYPSAATLVVPFILAGVLYGFFSAILGYDTTYKHVVAIVVHAGVLTTLSILVSYPVFYLKQSMSSPTSLFVFFPFLDETGVLARFLGIIDLFRLWWLANLAIGLGVLFKKRVGPIFTGFLILYGVIAVVYAGVSAFFSGD